MMANAFIEDPPYLKRVNASSGRAELANFPAVRGLEIRLVRAELQAVIPFHPLVKGILEYVLISIPGSADRSAAGRTLGRAGAAQV